MKNVDSSHGRRPLQPNKRVPQATWVRIGLDLVLIRCRRKVDPEPTWGRSTSTRVDTESLPRAELAGKNVNFKSEGNCLRIGKLFKYSEAIAPDPRTSKMQANPIDHNRSRPISWDITGLVKIWMKRREPRLPLQIPRTRQGRSKDQ